MDDLKFIFGSNSHWQLNKNMVKKIGIEATLLLTDLFDKSLYFRDRNELINDYFYNTRENIEGDTTLSPYQQRKALEILTEQGLVEMKTEGIPAKTYYKVVYDKVLKNLTTGGEKTSQQEIKKLNRNNNNKYNNKEIIINNNNKINTIDTNVSIQNPIDSELTDIYSWDSSEGQTHSQEELDYNEIVKTQKKDSSNYGNQIINKIISIFELKIGLKLTDKRERWYCTHLMNSLKKQGIKSEEEGLILIEVLIDKNLGDRFHSSWVSSPKKMYYNLTSLLFNEKNRANTSSMAIID